MQGNGHITFLLYIKEESANLYFFSATSFKSLNLQNLGTTIHSKQPLIIQKEIHLPLPLPE